MPFTIGSRNSSREMSSTRRCSSKVQEATSDAPKCTSYMPTVTGNGSVVYASGKDLIELDLKTGHWKRLAEAPAGVQNIAAGKDGALFFSCGADIYCLRR